MKKRFLILLFTVAFILVGACSAAAAEPTGAQPSFSQMYSTVGIQMPPALQSTTIEVGEKAVIRFNDNAYWCNNINTVTVNGNTTGRYSISDGKLTLHAANFTKSGAYIVIVNADGYVPAVTSVTVNGLQVPPILSASDDDNVVGQDIVITFVDDLDWRDAVTDVYVDDGIVSSDHYRLIKGQLTIDSSYFPHHDIYEVAVQADGYEDAVVKQEILPLISYTVSFNSQNGSSVASQVVSEGKRVIQPADPYRSGYTFGGWYRDAACQQLYNFNSAVFTDLMLYAKWNTITVIPDKYTTINLYLFDTRYTINGNAYVMDTAPVLYRYGGVNYTMVPLRFVAQALGSQVHWQASTKTVSLVKGGVTVTLKLNQIDPELGLDCPAVVKENRTMVPLRYVATSLNCLVNYTDTDEPIIITAL